MKGQKVRRYFRTNYDFSKIDSHICYQIREKALNIEGLRWDNCLSSHFLHTK